MRVTVDTEHSLIFPPLFSDPNEGLPSIPSMSAQEDEVSWMAPWNRLSERLEVE